MKARAVLMGLVSTMFLTSSSHSAENGTKVFQALLDGYTETPAVSSTGSGAFRATLNTAEDELSYELTYSGLEGGNTLFAHVHLGQVGVAGGVMFFLCGGGTKPAACPNVQGTVTGTVNASDIIGPNGQGIEPGSFVEVIRAMRSGVGYANVHTTRWANGEIRGQINDGRR
jgi:CHRD domain-containing protein